METNPQLDVVGRQVVHDVDLYENRSSFCLARSITMLTLATVCVALRFWCRKMRFTKYAVDDWMLLAALVSFPCCIASQAGRLSQSAADDKSLCYSSLFMESAQPISPKLPSGSDVIQRL